MSHWLWHGEQPTPFSCCLPSCSRASGWPWWGYRMMQDKLEQEACLEQLLVDALPQLGSPEHYNYMRADNPSAECLWPKLSFDCIWF